jgi:hypothetical protein
MRQLMTESMLVAVASGVLGFLMAMGLMHLASQEKLPYPMPLSLQLAPDGTVLLFTLGLTAFTGFGFGFIPAWRATRTDLTPALKEGGSVQTARFRRTGWIPSLRNLLVLSQVAVAGALAADGVSGDRPPRMTWWRRWLRYQAPVHDLAFRPGSRRIHRRARHRLL